MRQGLRSHLTYANVMVTILAFIVLGGGSAVALSGSNTVFTDDITDNEVRTADVRNDTLTGGGLAAADLQPSSVGTSEVLDNSLTSADITNGTVSVLDTRKTIPSGATITGSFREWEDNNGGTQTSIAAGIDFYGLRAPAPLTDANIVYDDSGVSAVAAVDAEESSSCTGSVASPTAPPGKVCIYLFIGGVIEGSASAAPLGVDSGTTDANDRGFLISGINNAAVAQLAGTWAYRAP